jgi:hypothetical protein|tara:strand:- start:270 stop:425 length:156 start_codon:yes stop_codon:yes gene_type:complete
MRILLLVLLLSGCASSGNKKLEIGYWLDGRSKYESKWQCVQGDAPYKSKEC